MEPSGGTSAVVVVAVAAAYLVACLVIGMWPGKRGSDSAAGYVAGDRSFGLLVMYFVTGATIFSAFAFLGGPERSYVRGGAAYYVLGYGILGFVPFYFLGPRAARLGRRYGFVTQAEMVAHRFRTPAIAGVMAIISVLAFVPYLGPADERAPGTGAGGHDARGPCPSEIGAAWSSTRIVTALRAQERRARRRLDQHLPGHLHDDPGLGHGSLPAVPAVRRRGGDVLDRIAAERRAELVRAPGPR